MRKNIKQLYSTYRNNMQRKKIVILTTLLTLLIGQQTTAQQANTMYFIKDNPLRHSLNPAFQPECRFYIGFPGLSSIDVSAGNNSLTFSDIYRGRVVDGEKETISFLHPDAEGGVDDFLKAYRKNLRIFTNVELSLLTFGFQVKQNYFTFDLSTKTDVQVMIPKAIPTVFFKGVEDKDGVTSFDLHNLKVSASAYTELALGYSYNMENEWVFGGKFKFLYGHANFNTDFRDVSLEISKEKWLLQGNASLSGAAPGLVFEGGEEDVFDGIDFDTDGLGFGDYVRSSGLGVGFDLGATYNLFENLQFSASLVDLGFIRWNKNVQRVYKNSDFEFDGILYDMNNDSIDYWKEYEEMFEDMFMKDSDPKSYTTWLTAKVYIGAEYSVLNDKIGFGLLSKTYITGKKMFEELVFSTTFRPFRPFSAALSYSLLDGKWSNLGLGLNVNAGALNFFLNVDQIPLRYAKGDGLLIPTRTKMANVSLGINFVIGKRKKETRVYPTGETEIAPLDSDGDGIPDKLDKCAETPREIEVDADGCPKDTDGDGVPDHADLCPDTPADAKGFVDEYGCEIDTDNDGVCDYMDLCPDMPGTIENNGCPEPEPELEEETELEEDRSESVELAEEEEMLAE